VPTVSLAAGGPTEVAADALVVTAFDDGLGAAATAVDGALGGALTEVWEARAFRGRFAERHSLPTLGRLPSRAVVLVGLGRRDQLDTYRLHNALQFAGQTARGRGARRVAVCLDADLPQSLGADVARALATGLLLANFDQGVVAKSNREDASPEIEHIEVVGPTVDDVGSALEEARVLAEATNQARLWAATPANRLTPTLFGVAAREFLEQRGVEVEVLDREQLEAEGMGALLGVAKGSDEPPVMVIGRYDGGRPDGPRLGLVGKGITFDTGGISLKPAGGMERMKYDMSGGAAVVAALGAIAELRLPVNVVAVVPATENMPSGHAYKPGDVLRSLSGKTIEVVNTDAEGRIILADGLAKARQLGATHLVDAATLTGAAIVALGHVTAAMMGNDRALVELVTRAAREAGDRVTELPLYPEYDVCLRSEVADMKNVGDRAAGTINGAVFLREFVEGTPWVHLDIAGIAWNDQSDLTVVPKGPTGSPVRTLVHLARGFATTG
jgi:leucyl aminopeptidase